VSELQYAQHSTGQRGDLIDHYREEEEEGEEEEEEGEEGYPEGEEGYPFW
jgi:hypothetical protein